MSTDLQKFIASGLEEWSTVVGRVPALKKVSIIPTTVGIKLADQSELLETLAYFFELGDQVHLGPVNQVRSIATIRKARPLMSSIRFIKLLERRPGRTDPTGPEHIDLLVPKGTDLDELAREIVAAGISAESEANDIHRWVSVRPGKIEFKLVDETVWHSCIREMQTAETSASGPLEPSALEIEAKA